MRRKGRPSWSIVLPFKSCLLIVASHQAKNKENTDILLIPQPSDDPNDPLNWPQWKKGTAFVTIQLFTFLSIWILAGIGAAIILIIDDFKVSLTQAVRGLISWMVLTIGLAVAFPSDITDIEFFVDSCLHLLWQTSLFPSCLVSSFCHYNLAGCCF